MKKKYFSNLNWGIDNLFLSRAAPSWRMFVSNVSKRLNRSGPNFVWDLAPKAGKIVSNSFRFCEFLKICDLLFVIVLLPYEEKMITDRATIKSLNRGWVPSALKYKLLYEDWIF